MFKGLLKYNQSNYHVFTTKDVRAENLGISAYSKDSLSEYLDDKSVTDKDCNCVFSQQKADLKNKLLNGSDDKYYITFDSAQNKYVKKDVDKNLAELIQVHDNSQIDLSQQQDEDTLNLIKEIQQSLHGCVHFFPFDDDVEYRLYFQDRNWRNNARVLGINGDPVITSVPRKATGRKYHFGITESQKEENNIGSYKVQDKKDFIIDNEDYTAKVNSKIRLSYNDALGYFESGTQVIIAKLLADLDAASLSELDFDTLEGADSADIYDPNSNNYTSQFATSVAMPMSVHNGNPYTFGPNIIDKDTFRKEKIRVVNRSPIPFKKNDTVLCLLIDNEWIVQGFGGDAQLEPAGIKLGRWSFTKLLANSDTYCKDDRFVTDDQYFAGVYQDSYVAQMREKFYRHLNANYFDSLSYNGLNDVATISRINASFISSIDNLDPSVAEFPADGSDFIPSKGYIQCSSFDLMGTIAGGNNPLGNIIGRTNMYVGNNTANAGVAEMAVDLGLFWGPVFTDGFNSAKVLNIKGQSVNATYNGIPGFFGGEGAVNVTGSTDAAVLGGMFEDQNDFNFYQLPADAGTNAGPDGVNGRPIESLTLLSKLEQGSLGDFVSVYNQFRSSDQRYSWISKENGESLFDLEPVNKGSLSFIPMSFSMAEDWEVAEGQTFAEGSVFQGMFARESSITGRSFAPTDAGYDPDEEVPASETRRSDNVLPWDIQILQKPAQNKGSNHLRKFYGNDIRGEDYDGANFVSITACKNTVRIGGGASVAFNTVYNFGLPAWTTVTGGQVTPPTILPIGGGIAFGGGTNAIRTYGFPQWGNSNSAVDQFDATSLKAAMYDHWPEEDMIYDARYFAPLHFNPGLVGSEVNTVTLDEGEVGSGPDDSRYERSADVLSYSVDFRVPTYRDATGGDDNAVVPLGVLVDRDGVGGKNLRPFDEWRVNPVCRGMMVSDTHGFRYFKRAIGLNTNYTVLAGGTGFSVGQEVELKNGAIIKIVSASDQGTISSESIEIVDPGEGFLPSSFESSETNPDDENETLYGYKATLASIGDSAVVLFHDGIVYDRLLETPYPVKHGSVNCVPRSNGEDGVVSGSQSSTIGVTTPNSSNQYDIFLFYYSDVGHVDLLPEAQTAGFLQYINLDIGSA